MKKEKYISPIYLSTRNHDRNSGMTITDGLFPLFSFVDKQTKKQNKTKQKSHRDLIKWIQS